MRAGVFKLLALTAVLLIGASTGYPREHDNRGVPDFTHGGTSSAPVDFGRHGGADSAPVDFGARGGRVVVDFGR